MAGAAICRLSFIAPDLNAGRLVQLSDVTIDSEFLYFLCVDAEWSGNHDVMRVAVWIVAAAERDAQRYAG